VIASLLAPLTRPELDALLADSEHAGQKAQIALACADLNQPGKVYAAAGVAVDCLGMWMDALDESIRRWMA
jgi:hypothetical protein